MKPETFKLLAHIYLKQGTYRLAAILRHMGVAISRAFEILKEIIAFNKQTAVNV